MNFSGVGNTVFFWDKKLVEIWYLLVTEKFLFWAFPWWEIRSSLRQKVYGKMIFTGNWKVLVLSFSVMRNAVMEIRYLLITEKFLFWAFRWREIQSFFIQKVDIKVIFTWYLWVFRDIPGPGKYGFSCSGFSSWIFSFFLFVYILRFAFLCFMPHYMDKVSWRLYYFYFSLLLLKLVAQVYIYSVGKKSHVYFHPVDLVEDIPT